jgi:hypothetical protein
MPLPVLAHALSEYIRTDARDDRSSAVQGGLAGGIIGDMLRG